METFILLAMKLNNKVVINVYWGKNHRIRPFFPTVLSLSLKLGTILPCNGVANIKGKKECKNTVESINCYI